MIHPDWRKHQRDPRVARAVVEYRAAYRAHDWTYKSAAWHRLKAAEAALNDAVEDAIQS